MLKKLKLKVKNDKNLHERIRVIAPDTIPTRSKSMHGVRNIDSLSMAIIAPKIKELVMIPHGL